MLNGFDEVTKLRVLVQDVWGTSDSQWRPQRLARLARCFDSFDVVVLQRVRLAHNRSTLKISGAAAGLLHCKYWAAGAIHLLNRSDSGTGLMILSRYEISRSSYLPFAAVAGRGGAVFGNAGCGAVHLSIGVDVYATLWDQAAGVPLTTAQAWLTARFVEDTSNGGLCGVCSSGCPYDRSLTGNSHFATALTSRRLY